MIPMREYAQLLLLVTIITTCCTPVRSQDINQMLEEVRVDNLMDQFKQQGFLKNYVSNLFNNFKSGDPYSDVEISPILLSQ